MVDQLTITIAKFLRHHLQEISFGITAVSLVLAGPHINGALKRATQALHWSLRYLLYVLLCTIGYSLVSKFVYTTIRQWVGAQHGIHLIGWVTGIFLLLAWLAKQQKEI